jgi:hypothetical protein
MFCVVVASGLMVGLASRAEAWFRAPRAQQPARVSPPAAPRAENWVTETVDSEGDVGQRPSLALDSPGHPHIAYHDVTNDRVRYALREATGWTSQTVEEAALTPSLALDTSGQPHIAFTRRGPAVRYAVLSGGEWVSETVDSPAADPSLALDSLGDPHIAYFDVRTLPPHGPGQGLKYAHRTAGGWVIESVDRVECDSVSLALDQSGTPHIVYHDTGGDSVKYAVLDGGTWVSETVESSATLPSLALDDSGKPHIAYTRNGPSVRYAVRKDGGWASETVDGAAAESSLAMDALGNPHIAYADVRPVPPHGPGEGLKYARRTAAGWVIEIVDTLNCTDPSAGSSTSLALDSSGNRHIAYYDADNGDLKVAHAEAPPGPYPILTMVGQVGGRTEDVAVQDGYAYVAVGLRLAVLDVSQPFTPTETGSTTPFPDFAMGVAVSRTVAYVAAGMAGLRVVDVSTPTAPVEMGVYDTPGYAESVRVAGKYAYVADGHYGLRIVDVSDPANPAEVAYAYPLCYVFDVAIDGQYAYLAAAGAGLLVVDISDPAHPVEVASLDTPGYAYGVDATDGVAYVADGWEHLRLVDVSDPAHPAEIGSYETPGWSFGVTVSGTRSAGSGQAVAYVADAFMGLQVVDVSDPTDPRGLGGEEVSRGHAGRVVVGGDTAYVADRRRGLRVVDVSVPSAPTQIVLYSPLGNARVVAVSGDHAYVGTGDDGLHVVSISDPSQPVEVGAHRIQGYATGVSATGDYAYLSILLPESGAGLHVLDVSDPANPVRIGYRDPARGAFQDMVVADGMAYLADEWGLQLVDVSSPYSPTLVGSINFQGEVYNFSDSTLAVDVSGDLAYVAGGAGLHIVDVSDPISPTLVHHFDDGSFLYDVAVAGDHLYINDADCVSIVSVTDPLSPTQLGQYCGPFPPERLTVISSTVYVAFGSGGLHAVDVADPSSPTLAFSHDTPGYATASAVEGHTICVADTYGGLAILELSDAPSELREATQDKSGSAAAGWDDGTPVLPPAHGFREGNRPLRLGTSRIRAQTPPRTCREFDTPPPSHIHRISGTCVVTSSANAGLGSLRGCLESAGSGDTITFDPGVFPPGSPVTITLQADLPCIWQGDLTLDASEAGVVLNGAGLGICSDGNVVRGLQILNAPYSGVSICCGAQGNVIGGNRMLGSGPTGEGNLVSGSGSVGVVILGTGTMSNTIIGNLIGTDASGTSALPNVPDGVVISDGASHNTIGSPVPGEGNVISGNDVVGVSIRDSRTVSNVVIGNFIGTDATGASALGNGWGGVTIENGASFNRVGGPAPGEGNVISGNANGIGINSHIGATRGNIIVGNFIGTDVAGRFDLGNSIVGLAIEQDAFHNLVKDNLISGNDWGDLYVGDPGTAYNTVVGNLVGTDVTGTWPLGIGEGVGVMNDAHFNRIGGTSQQDANVISANGLSLWRAHDNLVLGNLIGTNISGTRAISYSQGLAIGRDSTRNFVGGTGAAEGNVIAGSSSAGIWMDGASLNFILGNSIGTDASGTVAIGNRWSGITTKGARRNVIQRNLISGNEDAGVFLAQSSDFNHLRANQIGVATDGSPLPNGISGVSIEEASSNVVGGPYPEDGNLIAFNGGAGVLVWTNPANTIRRNSIYSNVGSGISLGGGGNNELAAPIVSAVTTSGVSGTACAECIVELFSDEEDEGAIYEGTAVADGGGNWTWSGNPTGPYVTATATDAAGNTSEFSAPQRLWQHGAYLPLVLKSES